MAFWDKWRKQPKDEEQSAAADLPEQEEAQAPEQAAPEETAEAAEDTTGMEHALETETAAEEAPPEQAPAETAEEENAAKEKKKPSLWQRLKKFYMGDIFGSSITEADEEFFEELEERLILADVGASTAMQAVEKLRKRMNQEGISGQEAIQVTLRQILAECLTMEHQDLDLSTQPSVILVIGVNGVGKTTSIGKLAARLKGEGKRVLLCAADTFRAAAADQLEIWAGRAGCELIRQHEGADPGSVLFDALQAAKARGVDVVICDTAGRLHNKANLMAELGKLRKIIDRETPDASLEVLLVLDATTGQNGLIQAKQFQETAGCTGIILTKLDGTAKGGIVIAIARELGVPVKFVGLGEGIGDLQPFDAREYVNAII